VCRDYEGCCFLLLLDCVCLPKRGLRIFTFVNPCRELELIALLKFRRALYKCCIREQVHTYSCLVGLVAALAESTAVSCPGTSMVVLLQVQVSVRIVDSDITDLTTSALYKCCVRENVLCTRLSG
jgi:hypothetical protein